MTNLENLGNKIYHIRKSMGLTQTEFAKRLGFDGPITISRYENNQREPGLSVLVKIAGLGNVNINWLLTGEGPRDKITGYKTDELFESQVAEPPTQYSIDSPGLTRLKTQVERIYKGKDEKIRERLIGFLAALDPGEKEK